MIYLYLILVNAACFLLMLSDKHRPKNQLWRIPEKVLFGVAAVGSSLGGLAGMYLFRHKTKHRQFTVGMPILALLQVLCFIAILTLI